MKYIDYTTSTVFVQLLNQFDRMFDSILYLRTVLIGYCHNILISTLSHKANPAVL